MCVYESYVLIFVCGLVELMDTIWLEFTGLASTHMQTPNKIITQQRIILPKRKSSNNDYMLLLRDYSRAESINRYDASRLTTNPTHNYVIFHLVAVGPVNSWSVERVILQPFFKRRDVRPRFSFYFPASATTRNGYCLSSAPLCTKRCCLLA